MAQAAVTNTFIIQMNFRLLYFAMENIKSTKLHDRNYWNRLQSIMYEQIDKNATYNKEFLNDKRISYCCLCHSYTPFFIQILSFEHVKIEK